MDVDAFLSGSDMVSEASDCMIKKADDMPGMPKTPKKWLLQKAAEEA